MVRDFCSSCASAIFNAVTNETNKWPSGVYDVYGIPKCTSGKLVYAMPNSEVGEVFAITLLKNVDY